ncbi:MAG: undecaprenyldiphospho-muramoylpentapeptide beta-N-acetylglucosaminyltransferase [Candidatus Phaeomarinobacter sp.]
MSGPIVIAAGGTGGHLFPGQALAQELVRRGQKVAVITDDRVEGVRARFPEADVFSVPSATPSGGGLPGVVSSIIPILRGILASRKVLKQLEAGALIGFGGYPTLPPLVAAYMLGIPTAVHEQNAVLGRVNRLMGPRVNAIASAFAALKYLAAKDLPKLSLTGNPVRDQIIDVADRTYVSSGDDQSFNLLVFGGSQGARVMSDIVPAGVAQLPDELRARLRIVQQARPEDVDRVKAAYEAAGVTCEVASFFEDMHEHIAAAQLVIARSGASTVTELAVVGRPSFLVPLPHAIDQDQLANAQVLSDTGGGWLIEQKQFTPEHVAYELKHLMTAPDQLEIAASCAKAVARPDAAARLADLVEALASGSTNQ